MITASVTDQPIVLQDLIDSVKTIQAGALSIFSGDVRDNDADKQVESLTYEIHPSAQKVIEEITARIAAKYDVINVAAVHRYGAIPMGESAFTVVVSAVHRGPAFAACDEIVSVVKAELPIWKYQIFADGTSEWVNSA
ncbi:MoaE Molybdopterin converting factor, large subunit [Candidatus Nanopelagicaceae bacterium]